MPSPQPDPPAVLYQDDAVVAAHGDKIIRISRELLDRLAADD